MISSLCASDTTSIIFVRWSTITSLQQPPPLPAVAVRRICRKSLFVFRLSSHPKAKFNTSLNRPKQKGTNSPLGLNMRFQSSPPSQTKSFGFGELFIFMKKLGRAIFPFLICHDGISIITSNEKCSGGWFLMQISRSSYIVATRPHPCCVVHNLDPFQIHNQRKRGGTLASPTNNDSNTKSQEIQQYNEQWNRNSRSHGRGDACLSNCCWGEDR